MRRWILLSITAIFAASAAFAEDTGLRRLETSDDGQAWDAVGRLDIRGSGFCTGALIAPNLVLTAGHCLFNKKTKERVDPASIEFLAGWRNGRASAYRNVRRAIVHPDYSLDDELTSERMRKDLALLELESPIRNTTIIPFGTAARPRIGDSVGVVSYAVERAEAPSLQETCTVVGLQDGILITSCSIDFGSSGAPIFAMLNGEAHIVSIVSAKAVVDGKNVSLGTELSVPLEILQTEMDADNGVFPLPANAPRVRVDGVRNDTGAKFIKP